VLLFEQKKFCSRLILRLLFIFDFIFGEIINELFLNIDLFKFN